MRGLWGLAISLAVVSGAPDKIVPKGAASNNVVAVDATGYFDRDSVKTLLGQDPGESILAIEVTLTPRAERKLVINRDDFVLRSDRDGQRAQPATPSQIAGSAVMVISSTGGQQGTAMPDTRRRPYGIPGIPGTGRAPASLPDPGATGGGAATADTSSATASVEDRPTGKGDSPLLVSLKQRILPEKESAEPVKGLLYFIIEGKQRPKDMELIYKTPSGRMSVRFK